MNPKNTIESSRTFYSMAERNTGSVQALAPAATVCVAVVGALIIGAAALLGGSAELHNATDAGLLNVAKQSLVSPSCPLQGQTEQDLFGDLLPDSSTGGKQLSLGTYNRVVARTLLYGFNAQELNTTESRSHFKDYVYPAYKALSNRLRRSMSVNGHGNDNNAQTIANCFTGTAGRNYLRFFAGGSQSPVTCSKYSTAYVPGDGSGATNVFFKPDTLPHDVRVPTIHVGDRDYVAGYKTITFFGTMPVQGVPVNPKEQPHLIGAHRFAAESNGDTVLPFMPPNAFKITAEKVVNDLHLLTEGCSVVGTMNSDNVGTLPDRGVITIANNIPGNAGMIANVNDRNVNSDWMNSNESSKGVYVTTNQSPLNNLMAVGTDAGGRLNAWVNYNTMGGGAPPSGSSSGIYAYSNGHWTPAGEAQLRSATNSMQGMPCNSNTLGALGDCARMAEQIAVAYKDIERNAVIPMDGNNLEAIEMQKLATLEKFIELGADHSPLVEEDDCINWRIPGSLTGLRVLDNGRGNNNPYKIPRRGNLYISKVGTPLRLLQYVGESDTEFLGRPDGYRDFDYSQFMSEIMRRVHQVCPDCTQENVTDALGSAELDLGQTKYLIMENGTVRMSANPPAWYRLSTPDGRGISYSKGFYDTLGTSVNSVHDDDIEYRYFWNYSRADKTLTIDWILWTPGSGIGTDVYTGRPVPYNLGEIKFTQTAREGGGILCKVN